MVLGPGLEYHDESRASGGCAGDARCIACRAAIGMDPHWAQRVGDDGVFFCSKPCHALWELAEGGA